MIESRAEPTTTKARSTATEYLVLEQVKLTGENGEPVDVWIERGNAASATRTGAVQKIAGDREGVWRPVPLRNWQQPIRTRHETVTKLKVEEIEP